MNHRRIQVVFILVILLISTFPPVVSTAATNTPVTNETVTGAAIPLPPQAEQQYLDILSNYTDTAPVSLKTHAFLVMTEQKTWVVATDNKPEAGIATVEGTAVTTADSGDSSLGVLFANSVSVRKDGQSAKLRDVRKNPNKYGFELVEITGNYRQFPYKVEASDKLQPKQAELGVLTTGQFFGWKPSDSTTRFGASPGKTGRWATLNLSSQKLGGERLDDLSLRLSSTGKSLYVYGGSQQFAMNGTVSVSALVLTRPVGVSGVPVPSDGPLLYLIESQPKSTSIPDVSAINDRGKELNGDVVTVDSQVLGARTSSKEFLLSVAKCAPESVAVPVTPPGCVPVVTDSVIHSGVLSTTTPSSKSDFVGFVGVSNYKQDVVTQPIRGSFEITGRVVATDKVSPALPDGYVIVVYRMEKKGELAVNSQARSSMKEYSQELQAEIHTQLKQGKSSARQTATTEETQKQKSTSQDTGGEKSGSGDRSIFVTDADIVDNNISSDETARIKATVRNYDSSPATQTIDLQIGYRKISEKKVRVAGDSTKEITFIYKPQPHQTMAVFRVGTKKAGTLYIDRDSGENADESAIHDEKQATTNTEGFGTVEAPTSGFSSLTALSTLLIALLFLARQ